MKKYSFLVICFFFSLLAFSQNAIISFDELTYDFGKVNEENGKISHVFNFTNKGKTPLVITKVQASCGCTTPTWTKEPIEPGKKGTITVIYNPEGRPGVFNKSITVGSNASEEQLNLIIKGDVIPKPTNDNQAYPYNIEDLRLRSKIVQLNNINKGDKQVRVLNIQNTSNAILKPSIENLPPYITATVFPDKLKPNEEGKITFTYNSKINAQWGVVTDDIYLIINGRKKYSEENKITIVANIVEDFSKMTLDQKRKSPILEIQSNSVNLGIVKQGSIKVGKFKISNKGQNTLEIRKITNNNKELKVKNSKLSITVKASKAVSQSS